MVSASDNQNDVIQLILHNDFILLLQITRGPDTPFNAKFVLFISASLSQSAMPGLFAMSLIR